MIVIFVIIRILVQASRVMMNTNESSTDVSPGKSSHQDKEHASAFLSTLQSPEENQMTLTAVKDPAPCEHA